MWDDMDRLGQPAFHERASKVGSSAVPAHLFHHFPRHGHNMRSWSWIGQFLKFHDEFDVWEFGTAWNLSWKIHRINTFLGFHIAGGSCVGDDQDLGDYSTRIDMYLFYLALTYLKSGQLREQRDLIPLSCSGWPAKVREASANSVKLGHHGW